MTITVRRAREADITAISAVMTESVVELCSLDHHDDPQSIAQWVGNRTPDSIARMLANPQQSFLVAERAGDVAGVGAATREGKVIFNYVAPAHRFKGVSRAMIAALEQLLRDWGHSEGRLISTVTAHDFYLKGGWVDEGPAEVDAPSNVTVFPMRKTL